MRPIARTIHSVIAWLMVAGLVVQVYLAGRGMFETSAGFAPHRDLGYTLGLVPLLLLILGFVGGMGRRVALMALLIFALLIIQSVLVVARTTMPAVAALHPVNGFLILLIALMLARESWAMRTATT